MTARHQGVEVANEGVGSGNRIYIVAARIWVFRKKLKVLLATTALMSAALISLSQLSSGQNEAHGNTPSALAPQEFATPPPPLPPANARVFKQSMPHYHWHQDCPLAGATSLRTGTKKAALHRKWMSREEAEKQRLSPCIYCRDLD